MAGEAFRFKKFQVSHHRSSMPVGTDAVLLGAWADTGVCMSRPQARVLDVGCGCGLIALMVAQRCPSVTVVGIDIDPPSIEEANENALQSPFADRVGFLLADVCDFAFRDVEKYELILCNPPYYTEDTLPPDERRSRARNTSSLSFAQLLRSVSALLATDGVFSVVIPMQARDIFVGQAMLHGLHLHRECRVVTVSSKTPKRVLLEFGFQSYMDVILSSLVLQEPGGGRSCEYAQLCKDFYL